jgi:hypothetical protein
LTSPPAFGNDTKSLTTAKPLGQRKESGKVKRIKFGEVSASATVGFTKAKRYMLPSLVGTILLAVAVLAPSTTQASTLITYEGFPYPAIGPANLSGQTNGGIGWEFGWGGGGVANGSSYAITNGSVADPSGLLYTYSNSVYSAGGYAGRFFTAPSTWANPGTTNYFSIVIKPTVAVVSNHFYGLQIYSLNDNTGNASDLLVGKNGSGMNWGLESGIGTDAYSTVAAQANVPVLLVVRVIFEPAGFGTPDFYTLYVNPTPGQPEPTNSPSATLTGDIGNQNGIQLDDGNGGAALFDEVRIGATFASVTPTSNNSSDPNLIAWEPFAYNQGFSTGLLDGEPSDGTQANNGWDNVTWDGAGLYSGETNYTLLAGSLSDPSGKLLTSGNSVHTASSNNSFYAAGRYNVYTVLPAKTNANPTYYSILIRPDNLGSTNGAAYLDIFGQPNNNNLLAGYLFGGTTWGIQSSNNQNLSSSPVVSNQTALLVVRVNNAGANNPTTVLLYVNPTPGSPEPATANATNIWTYSGEQNGLAIVTQNGAAATFDEIRVGTNYADVTPVTQVSSNAFVISSIQVFGGTNVVVSFLSTSNVVYQVQQDTDLVTGTWTTIASGIPGTGGTIQFTNVVSSATTKRFYRVTHP